jgi:hypothetical protein
MITGYQVIEDETIRDLERNVNNLLAKKEGWEPLGPVQIFKMNGSRFLYQTMIRVTPTESNGI